MHLVLSLGHSLAIPLRLMLGMELATLAWRVSLPTGASYDDNSGVRPVLYLKSNISLEGEGTQSDPFTIS